MAKMKALAAAKKKADARRKKEAERKKREAAAKALRGNINILPDFNPAENMANLHQALGMVPSQPCNCGGKSLAQTDCDYDIPVDELSQIDDAALY